jgi:hypothetical protein
MGRSFLGFGEARESSSLVVEKEGILRRIE